MEFVVLSRARTWAPPCESTSCLLRARPPLRVHVNPCGLSPCPDRAAGGRERHTSHIQDACPARSPISGPFKTLGTKKKKRNKTNVWSTWEAARGAGAPVLLLWLRCLPFCAESKIPVGSRGSWAAPGGCTQPHSRSRSGFCWGIAVRGVQLEPAVTDGWLRSWRLLDACPRGIGASPPRAVCAAQVPNAAVSLCPCQSYAGAG